MSVELLKNLAAQLTGDLFDDTTHRTLLADGSEVEFGPMNNWELTK